MSLAACADLVRRGDPDRFLATMSAPPRARGRLFALYAFNLETARARYLTADPLIAQMRLTFWQEVVEEAFAGQPARAHEVAAPLTAVIREAGLPRAPFGRLLAARMAEAQGNRPPVPDFARETGGQIMLLAARALDRQVAREPLLVLGTASGLANWLLATPSLARVGRGFVAPDRREIRALAQTGQALLAQARASAALKAGAIRPALRSAWRAGPILARAARRPEDVLAGSVGGSEFRRRAGLLARSLTARW